jgi:hypothetical protein
MAAAVVPSNFKFQTNKHELWAVCDDASIIVEYYICKANKGIYFGPHAVHQAWGEND